MRVFHKASWLFLVLVPTLWAAAEAQDSETSPPAAPAATEAAVQDGAGKTANSTETEAKRLPWLSNLNQGQRQAMATGSPLLVRAGAAWCPKCRSLEREIAKREVQAELSRWVLVYINADTQGGDAEKMNVTLLPTLQLRTPNGRVVATQQGAMSAEDLLEWLKKNHASAKAAPDLANLSIDKPDALALVRLVRDLEDRSGAVRETAMRRLLHYPEESRESVVKAFGEGSLAAKLSAWELLQAWRAPLEELDPWVPETMTPERLALLEKWCDAPMTKPADETVQLTPEVLAAAVEQIDRMLKGSEEEADAIRQRLARFGEALLPEVYARLKDAPTAQHHQRLLALRYRLVAGDALALRWPGGLIRLAASDSRQRQQAADELAAAATAADQRLLLELFSDPDPLVREICLRGLQHMGGKEATGALVNLLADPEPNVRAAVLKQLETEPQPGMAAKVADYLEKETDPDLLVHGIRFLGTASGPRTIKCLMKLLKHDSWQVRAEAAAGIAKGMGDGGFDSSTRTGAATEGENLKVDAYVALMGLLEDTDSFVVSKAIESLANADMPMVVEPMVKAAEKHPDLAPSIVLALTDREKIRSAAIPHLRKYCKHSDERIRAVAILGLCRAAADNSSEEILTLLADNAGKVRLAAANAMWQITGEKVDSLVERMLDPGSRSSVMPALGVSGDTSFLSTAMEYLGGMFRKKKATPVAEVVVEETPHQDPPVIAGSGLPEEEGDEAGKEWAAEKGAQWDAWLAETYSGKKRPKWTEEAIPLLEKMLSAEDKFERVAAAKVLVPLGRSDKALPVLLDGARSNEDLLPEAAEVLPWLVWSERLRIFHELLKMPGEKERRWHILVRGLATVPDSRLAGPFWELLGDSSMTAEVAAAVEQGLMIAHFGKNYWRTDELGPTARKRIADALRPHLTAGAPWQRFVALILMAKVERDEVVQTAAAMADDASMDKQVRRLAFQVMLVAEDDAVKRTRMAVAAMSSDDLERRKTAVEILVGGGHASTELDNLFSLSISGDDSDGYRYNGEPIIPKAPAGLKVEHVLPLAKDEDPQIAAYAGYLLAIMENPAGVDALLRYYQTSNKKQDLQLARLVYRALAVLDDPKSIGVLKEIAGNLSEYEISEFYWTIRIMSGPEILRFRKELREKYGLDALR